MKKMMVMFVMLAMVAVGCGRMSKLEIRSNSLETQVNILEENIQDLATELATLRTKLSYTLPEIVPGEHVVLFMTPDNPAKEDEGSKEWCPLSKSLYNESKDIKLAMSLEGLPPAEIQDYESNDAMRKDFILVILPSEGGECKAEYVVRKKGKVVASDDKTRYSSDSSLEFWQSFFGRISEDIARGEDRCTDDSCPSD